MKSQLWTASAVIVSGLIVVGAMSCGENGTPPPQSHGSLASAGQPAAPAAKPMLVNQPANSDAPIPPKDAQWTILCDMIQGPGHVEQALLIRDRLRRMSGMSDWYLIHDADDTSIYYGYYRSLDNPAEKMRAAQDRARIAALTDQLGNRLLRSAQMVQVVAPDPQAPADWNLVNTPKTAYWTIEIMTFADNPKRKEAAVEAVREIRAHGENECYFYHGPTASSVCIGAWPKEAVAEQGTGLDKKGDNRDDAHNLNPNQSVLVFGGPDVAPSNVAGQVQDPATGKPMTVEGQKLNVQDPDMKAKIARYPNHAVNYEVHGTQNGNQVIPDPSVLVVIPHTEAGGEDDWRLNGGFQPPAPAGQANRNAPTSPGDSLLRSFGDH
jgi:hypothetical protein